MSTLTAAVLPWPPGVAIHRRSHCAASLPRRSLAAQAQTQTQPQPQPLIGQQQRRAPWLLLSSRDKPESRYLYDLTSTKKEDDDSGSFSVELNRELHLPDLANHSFIGSSQGFLISINDDGEMCATDPLTGANLPLPPTVSLPGMAGVLLDSSNKITDYAHCVSYHKEGFQPPNIESFLLEDLRRSPGGRSRRRSLNSLPDCISRQEWHHGFQFLGQHWMQHSYFDKAIISPCLGIAAVIHSFSKASYDACDALHIAFAQLELGSSLSWTALSPPLNSFSDIIFHDGRLHAIDYRGTLTIFDLDNPNRPPPFRSSCGPLHYEEDFINRFLVESPDGEDLFLVYRRAHTLLGKPMRTATFKVFKLSKSSYKWRPLKNLGDIAIFLGTNHSFSLSASHFPSLTSNCIYFTDSVSPVHDAELYADTGVYNMLDGRIHFLHSSDGPPKLRRQKPIWFMPAPRRST